MLTLRYDIRCGFKELYMTEKNIDFELSCLCDTDNISEDELYNIVKDFDQAELEDYFTDNGILNIIAETTAEDYGHTYFKDICFENREKPYLPGYIVIYNIRIIRDANAEPLSPKVANYRLESTGLKASEVMAILGISRQTLSRYVKAKKIKINQAFEGAKYTYDYDSVMKLKEGK